jgi:hypothetical protein
VIKRRGDSTSGGMWGKMDMKSIHCIILAFLFSFSMFLSMMLDTPQASAWVADVSIDDLIATTSVNTVYVNRSMVIENAFGIVVENTGSQSMKITWMGIHFDWQTPLDSNMGGVWPGMFIGEEIVLSGATYRYDWVIFDVPMDTSLGYHTATVGIEAADPAAGSSWGAPTHFYLNLTVYVIIEPASYSPPVSPPPDSTNGWLLPVIIGVAIVATIIVVIYYGRRPVKLQPNRSEPVQAVSVNDSCKYCGKDINPGSAFCKYCGMKK